MSDMISWRRVLQLQQDLALTAAAALTLCFCGASHVLTAQETVESAPAQPLPSVAAFEQFWQEVRRTPSEDRDYDRLLVQIEGLCRRHAGSDEALWAIICVEKWVESGAIDTTSAQPIIALRDTFNPGKDEFEALHKKYETLKGRPNSTQEMTHVAEALEALAKRHKGTLTEYYARSQIAGVYIQAGEVARAKGAATAFLNDFPPGRTDMAGNTAAEYGNLFRDAYLAAKTDSVQAGLQKYWAIADGNKGRKAFDLTALYTGGELARENNMQDEVLKFFTEAISRYTEDQDQRVIVSHFRIGEALLVMGNTAAAAAIFTDLADRHKDDRFGKAALNWIKNVRIIEAKLKENPWSDPAGGSGNAWATGTGKSARETMGEVLEEGVAGLEGITADSPATPHDVEKDTQEPPTSTDPPIAESGAAPAGKGLVWVLTGAGAVALLVMGLWVLRRRPGDGRQ
ncbi:MAG: hypothetical protein JW955_08335 [Sedimentisphaerales bacterium]|nr:hypothetical protein [Sedimentisphaerales bacterium]